MIRRRKITIDFETRSEADLRAVGTWNYSKHPSTEIMCLSWRFGGESGRWHMHHGYKIAQLVERAKKAKARSKHDLAKQLLKDAADLEGTPDPDRLFELIAEGHEVEAHNVFFERCIWQHICVERMGWPGVKEEQWRCSAAKASMHALPRDLERATGEMCPDKAKDMEGRRVMLKLSKPAPPTKAEPGRKWHEEPDDLRILWAYCDQDVVSEEALSESLIDLPPYELELWQMDQRMNLRGFYCDFDLARKAIDLSTALIEELSGLLSTMTHGEINKPSQRAVIKDWLNARLRAHNGVEDPEEEIITSTGAPILRRLLIEDPTLKGTDLHKVVGIVHSANRTSIKKYQAMLDRADPVDQRIRDMMMYHGAGTGRWSGKGVQPHNFPRGFLKNMEAACDVLLSLDLSGLRLCYSTEELLDLLSWALRGALMAPEGRQLYVADYAAIEARVLLWLAGDERALDVFRYGKDIYIDMATDIYSMAYEDIKKDSEHRRMGKQAILGLGYQMGAPKFWDTAAGYEPHYKNLDQAALEHFQDEGFMMLEGERILGFMKNVARKSDALSDKLRFGQDLNPEEEKLFFHAGKRAGREMALNVHYFMFFRKVVNKYRKRYPKVKEMWNNQNGCAIAAVQDPGESYEASRVSWLYDRETDFLTCTLPSGRLLYYRRPELGKNKFGKQSLYYWSVDPVNKQWRRTGTYGGKLTENITQAVARDLMADAMLRIDKGDTYDLLASVHDELICEADLGRGDVEEFEQLMSACPSWAEGCPVKAEGWRGLRYRK